MQKTMLTGLLRAPAIAAFALCATALAAPTQAAGVKFDNIYSFCTDTPDVCFDGKEPTGNLYSDVEGNLFGTTVLGGQNNAGTVYEIVRDIETGRNRHKKIYNFCASAGCTDGAQPHNATLIADVQGRLFGTASGGGEGNNNGVVFMLTPNAAKTRWTYRRLYSFCKTQTGCEDGSQPIGGLTYAGAVSGVPYDDVSPLYGTTLLGGKKHVGVVFSLKPGNTEDADWVEKVLYFFCTAQNCADGKSPNGGIVVDGGGNLVGTTSQGGVTTDPCGATGCGVAYRLTPSDSLHWTETVLHQFCSSANCADGSTPESGITIDGSGNFFGTTTGGGNAADVCGAAGCGVVFKIDPHGLQSQPYTFCAQENCADGGVPTGLTLDANGALFGLTNVGGNNKSGTMFKLTGSTLEVLGSFKCKKKSCTNGTAPEGDLLVDSAGDIFGTMSQRGKHDGGTLFELPAATE